MSGCTKLAISFNIGGTFCHKLVQVIDSKGFIRFLQ